MTYQLRFRACIPTTAMIIVMMAARVTHGSPPPPQVPPTSVATRNTPCGPSEAETITGLSLFEPFLQYQFTANHVRSPDGECAALSALASKACGANTPVFLTRQTKDDYATDFGFSEAMLGPILYPMLSEIEFPRSHIGIDPTTYDFALGGFVCQNLQGKWVGPEMIWMVHDGGTPLDAPKLAGIATWHDGGLHGYCAEYHPSGALASISLYHRGRLIWSLFTVIPANKTMVTCDPPPTSSTVRVPMVELDGLEPDIVAISAICEEYRDGQLDGLTVVYPPANDSP